MQHTATDKDDAASELNARASASGLVEPESTGGEQEEGGDGRDENGNNPCTSWGVEM